MKENYYALLSEYLDYLRLRGHRAEGIKSARLGVMKFLRFLDDGKYTLRTLGARGACEYQGWLVSKGRVDGGKYAGNTIVNHLVSASSFFDFLKAESHVLTNPFKDVRRVRREFKVPGNILKEQELDRLLNGLADYHSGSNLKRKISRYRVHVIAELMYATGLRISEAGKLKLSDIDFESALVRVNEGKHGESRLCLVNEYALNVLRLYVEKMRDLVLTEWTVESERLFGTGDDALKRLVNGVLAEECEKLQLPKQTSHALRHALGFHLLRRGCDIRYIQAILGHKSLKDTEIYTKVEKEDLREVLEKFHPRQMKRGML